MKQILTVVLLFFLATSTLEVREVSLQTGKGPSAHLSWRELCCNDGGRTPYPDKYIEDGRVFKLADVFESLREHLGGNPLHVNSAYRTEAHQKVVNPKAKHSKHISGEALDIKMPPGMTRWVFFDKVGEWVRNEPRVGGVGYYPGFVHIDIRKRPKSGRVIAWASDRKLLP